MGLQALASSCSVKEPLVFIRKEAVLVPVPVCTLWRKVVLLLP
jgi:hypothetical protein